MQFDTTPASFPALLLLLLSSPRSTRGDSVSVYHASRFYRLGDLYGGYIDRQHRANGTANPHRSYFCDNWPASIGCAYVRRTTVPKNATALMQIVGERLGPRPAFLSRTDLVVHLRLGDVLDLPYYQKRRRGERYVRPPSLYSHVPLPPGVTTVRLVSNATFRAFLGNARSEAYRQDVAARFRARNLTVALHRGVSADADLLFMARACHLLVSGGGFSALAAAIVRRYGHSVLTLESSARLLLHSQRSTSRSQQDTHVESEC